MKTIGITATLIFIITLSSCNKKASANNESRNHNTSISQIDGNIINGLRVIELEQMKKKTLSVYRGDYIILKIKGVNSFKVKIPQLKINKQYPYKAKEKKYIKMKKAGTYSFTAGPFNGTINVIEYNEPHYKSVTADEAEKIIKNISPLILDVRTPFEYSMGHIKNSKLIPISSLQMQIDTLASYKNSDILIYCATGNRSTVAAKILIDNGFKKIYNMRYGISEWSRNGKKIVR